MSLRRLVAAAGVLVLVVLVATLFFVPVPAIQGGIVGGLLGLLSAQSALFVDRYLRERGELIIELSDHWTRATPPIPQPAVEDRTVRVMLYNKREVAVGMWRVYAEFSRGDDVPTVLLAQATQPKRPVISYNLPPREAVIEYMKFQTKGDELERVREAGKAELVFDIAGEGQLRRKLPHWTAL